MRAHEAPLPAIIAERNRRAAPFVDIVAIVEDEIGVFIRQVAIGRLEPVLIMLAAGNREPHPVERRAGHR
jgi:hypothetical protein